MSHPSKKLHCLVSLRLSLVVTTLALLTACASSPTARSKAEANIDPRDPYENWNRKVQSFNNVADDYVLKPVAQGYQWVMPDFAEKGVSNFFGNFDEISVIANDTLQGKFSQAGQDTARFLVNTTAGIGGFMDVASDLDLPKHNESFSKTLGEWGVGTGPYLVLPLVGSSTARGLGNVVDMALKPTTYMTGSAPVVLGVTKVVSKRAEILGFEKVLNESGMDRYVFFKNAYFAQQSGNQQNHDPLEGDGQ